MTDTDIKCRYHILHPQDNVQDHLNAYRDVNPDKDVYLAKGLLTIINGPIQKPPIELKVIVCENK